MNNDLKRETHFEGGSMNTLAQRLAKLSSAEDFMAFFALPYEESVLNVSRLHILKRFFQYMRQEQISNISDETETFRQMRNLLAKSYEDFVHSTPAKEKVFKVLQDADGQRVSITTLRDSLRQKR
jgi:nitrogenase-stabilizing/protective protein